MPEPVLAQTDPWSHREAGWNVESAAQSASLLALSNGYLGIRGSVEEGCDEADQATFLNGFYESVPFQAADVGHGDPRQDEVLAPVADGTRIELTVEDEPLDMDTGVVISHTRDLDLRSGVLTRVLHWRSPGGIEIVLRTRRLVSLELRAIAAIEYEIESIQDVRVTVRSTLAIHQSAAIPAEDPRAGSRVALAAPTPLGSRCDSDGSVLVHGTRASRNMVAAAMAHHGIELTGAESSVDRSGLHASWINNVELKPSRVHRFVKFLAYHWERDGNPEELQRRCRASIDEAVSLGFDRLVAAQRKELDDVWHHADIELDGDPEIQHALRYALFQIHQNAVFADGNGIPAKGLTGRGYNGHTFWDTEIFLLPLLLHCAPERVAAALRWRASTLPQARERAKQLGLRGSAFPWRTISGAECSAYLPAGTAAFHVNADIARAVAEYVSATGDVDFEREVGVPLLVETARLWASLGYHDDARDGRFSIDGVTGPDEYSVLVDNNTYTNLMARANLLAAVEAVERHGREECGIANQELKSWRNAADAMFVPYHDALGINLQDEDFARHQRLDFEDIGPDAFPLFLHVPYFELYRRQVIKQPDLVLAMVLHPEAFTFEQKVRNFAYYEAVTVRDSSLSAGTLSAMAAELGDMQLAYDYLAEAALLDHHDTARNTSDGLHLAALAGGWSAVISGLAGARQIDGNLSFAPRLPGQLQRIAFPYAFGGCELRVEFTQSDASYELIHGDRLSIKHFDTTLDLTAGSKLTAAVHPVEPAAKFSQPAGRAPRRRGRSSTE